MRNYVREFISARLLRLYFLAFTCVFLIDGIALADKYRGGIVTESTSMKKADKIESAAASESIGNVIHQIPSPETDYSHGLAWDGQYLWVAGAFDSMIYRLNPTDGTAIISYEVSIPSLRGLTWDGSHLWVSSWDTHNIYKLNPSDGSVIASFPAPFSGGAPNGLAWAEGFIWIAEEDGLIYKVNPLDGSVAASFTPPSGTIYNPRGLAWDGQYLWAGYQVDGMIYQLDPEDGSIINSFSSPSGAYQQGLAWDGQYLWSTGGDNVIYKIDVGYEPPHQQPPEHFTCYQVVSKAKNKHPILVESLKDQFLSQEDVKIVGPVEICAPADKNQEGVVNWEHHLVCYNVYCPREMAKVNQLVEVENQFGTQRLRVVGKTRRLCVPSTIKK